MTIIIRLFMLAALLLVEYIGFKIAISLFAHGSSSAFDLGVFICVAAPISGLAGLIKILQYEYERGEA